MFKFVVCALFVTIASAAPGIVGHYPGAVSHVSRVDVHDDHGYASPVYAPLGYGHAYGGYGGAYGAYGGGYGGGYGGAYGYGYPAAHSYSNRIDIHAPSAPIVPAYGHGYGGYGIHDGHGYGYAVHGYGIHGLHHGY